MKALTVWQPWASLIAAGVKQYETRSWRTNYRGPLAIHAANRKPKRRELALPGLITAMLDAGLREYGAWKLPRGRVLAVAELMDCQPVEDARLFITDRERRLGDWSAGRYAWVLEVEEVLTRPVSAIGQQGLWTWEPAEQGVGEDR